MVRLDSHRYSAGRAVGVAWVLVAVGAGVVVGSGVFDASRFGVVLAAIVALAVGGRRPAMLIGVFLTAGAFKAALSLPVDLSVTSGLLVGLLAVMRVVRVGTPERANATIWLFALLVCMVGAGVAWTPAPEYAFDKFLRFAVLGGLSFYGTWVLLRDRVSIRQLMWTLAVIGVLLSAQALIAGGNASFGGRLSTAGSDTIWLGRAAGTTALALLALAANGELPGRVPALLAGGLSLAALIGAGSRGPLLGVIAAMTALVAVRVASSGSRIGRILVVALVGVLLVGLAVQFVPESAVARYERVLGGDPGESALARVSLAARGVHMIPEHPIIGSGTAAFSSGRPTYEYPHNIFIELAAENGLLAMAVAVALVVVSMVRAGSACRRRAGTEADWVLMMLVAGVVNALVSSDLNGHRLLYVFFPLALWVLPQLGHQGIGESRVSAR